MTLDSSLYEERVRELVANLTESRDQVIKQEMGLLAKELINVTTPFGLSKDAQRIGDGAVDKDIKKLFTGMNAYSLDKWRKRLPNVRTSVNGEKMFSDHFDPSIHSKNRTNGKVIRRGAKTIRIGVLEFSDKVHVEIGKLNSYIKLVQKRVGEAKAGWLAAALKYGATGIPAWVSRHEPLHEGYVREMISKDKMYIEAVNTNKAIVSLNAKNNILQKAFDGRAEKIKTRIEILINNSIRTAFKNFK